MLQPKGQERSVETLSAENNAMREFLARIPRHVYYDHKYPQMPIVYTGIMTEDGRANPDVRSFLTDPFETQELDLSPSMPDDFIVLSMRQWVVDNITWVNDKNKHGLTERWMYPSETMSIRKGDCTDGAILLVKLILEACIPSWKIRLNAGPVFDAAGQPAGKHLYAVYYFHYANEWVALDWCFLPDLDIANLEDPHYRDSKIFGKGDVWFSFNDAFSYAKSQADVSRFGSCEVREAPEEPLDMGFGLED